MRDRRREVRRAYGVAPLPFKRLPKLCIVTAGRTGSELLVDALDGHPAMHCDGELLWKAPYSARLFVRGKANQARLRGARAYGFKLVSAQVLWPMGFLQPRLFFEDLAAYNFTFVHLSRRNVARQALSFLRAKRSNVWHVREPGKSDIPVALDVTDLVGTAHWVEEQDASIESLLSGLAVRRLWYEDDLETHSALQSTADRIFADLGLESHVVHTTLQKQGGSDILRSLANADEIIDALQRTRYRDQLRFETDAD